VAVITILVLPTGRQAYIGEWGDYCDKLKTQFHQILSGATPIKHARRGRTTAMPTVAKYKSRVNTQLRSHRRPLINGRTPRLLGIYNDVPYNNGLLSFEMNGLAPIAFQQEVMKRADKQSTIFLSIVDSGYADMGRNLYETSYVALNITNYLFVGLDAQACDAVRKEVRDTTGPQSELACVTYFSDVNGNQSSDWGSEGFRRKTHYKTKVILDTLRFGITVVIVDLDIVFFRNPLPYFNCSKCDIEIQSDVTEGNSGFYIARPTKGSISLHEKALMLGIGMRGRQLTNQKALSRIIEFMKKLHKLKVRTLNAAQFPWGSRYFEAGRIMFSSDGVCDDCVIVHNNWIVTKAAKVYRFKETGLWSVDTGGYYSDPSRKYLTYENVLDFASNDIHKLEANALRVALFIGHLLNRTVILPTFSCYGCTYGACNNTRGRCALNTNYRVITFDRHVGGGYRENEFLRHPLVPNVVRQNQSRFMLIESLITRKYHFEDQLNGTSDKVSTPVDSVLLQTTPAEILRWFGATSSHSLLRFHSMYGVFSDHFATSPNYADGYSDIREKIRLAIQSANYRQYK